MCSFIVNIRKKDSHAKVQYCNWCDDTELKLIDPLEDLYKFDSFITNVRSLWAACNLRELQMFREAAEESEKLGLSVVMIENRVEGKPKLFVLDCVWCEEMTRTYQQALKRYEYVCLYKYEYICGHEPKVSDLLCVCVL